MNLKYILLGFIIMPFIVNAQIGDTIIKHNNEKIYKFNGINYFPLIFNDIDQKENNWLGLYNKGNYVAYKVDNNLNIIDSITNYMALICIIGKDCIWIQSVFILMI